jgi:hypothetical protein
LQHREDPPPAPGRPSLLSTEQQEAAARASAQARQAAQAADSAALKADSAARKADRARRSKKGWLAGGVALLVACAGVGAWVALDGAKPAEVSLAAAPEAAPAKAAEAVEAAPAKTAEHESEVSAAAILDHGAAPAAAVKRESLKEMLDAPAPPAAPAAAKTGADELDQLLASSPPDAPEEQLKGALHAPSKPVPREQKAAVAGAVKKPVLLAKAAPAKPLPAKPAPGKEPGAKEVPGKAAPAKAAPGDDASLLAALVAHSKEGGASAASNPGAAPTSLRQCKQLNAAEAEQCKVRLCAGSAKDDPQCKSLRVAKPAAD